MLGHAAGLELENLIKNILRNLNLIGEFNTQINIFYQITFYRLNVLSFCNVLVFFNNFFEKNCATSYNFHRTMLNYT